MPLATERGPGAGNGERPRVGGGRGGQGQGQGRGRSDGGGTGAHRADVGGPEMHRVFQGQGGPGRAGERFLAREGERGIKMGAGELRPSETPGDGGSGWQSQGVGQRERPARGGSRTQPGRRRAEGWGHTETGCQRGRRRGRRRGGPQPQPDGERPRESPETERGRRGREAGCMSQRRREAEGP